MLQLLVVFLKCTLEKGLGCFQQDYDDVDAYAGQKGKSIVCGAGEHQEMFKNDQPEPSVVALILAQQLFS